MTTEVVSEQPGGMSTRKKWLIGCGGCLGAMVVLALIIGIVLFMGWNALQKASGDSIKDIFGPAYDTTGYTAFGLPVNQKNFKRVAMLLSKDGSTMIFAIDTVGTASEVKILQSGTQEQLDAYFKAMGHQFLKGASAQSSTSKLRDVQFSEPHYARLDDSGKHYPVVYATVEGASKGKVGFVPGVFVMIPEANNEIVAMVALAPKATAQEPLPSFKEDQAQLEAELARMIKDSELDDRLLSSEQPTNK